MNVDVVIVGGSFAGLQAAMALGRQLFSVVVFDTGLPRNRFATGAHNVLAADGKLPGEILSVMRAQTLAYSTVTLQQAKVTKIQQLEKEGDPTFQVYAQKLENKEEVAVKCRRIILAQGVSDSLPAISNIWDFWGVGIAHCPHCHGYESRGQRLGVLKSGSMAMAVTQISMAKELSPSKPVVLFTNGAVLTPEEKRALPKGTILKEGRVARLVGDQAARSLKGVVLEDGSEVAVDCVYLASATAPQGELHTQLNLKTEPTMTGSMISCDAQRQSSVKGVYVAGDAGSGHHQVAFASASGLMAGIQNHISLMLANNARANL